MRGIRRRLERLEGAAGEGGPLVVVASPDDPPEERARTAAAVAEARATGRMVINIGGNVRPPVGPPTSAGVDGDEESMHPRDDAAPWPGVRRGLHGEPPS